MTEQLTANSGSWIVETWSQSTPVSVASRPPKPVAQDGIELQAEIIIRVMTQMLRCPDPDEASRLLANRLQQFLGCRQVAVGICPRQRHRCRICGLSGVVRFDSQSRFITGIQDALEETLAHESATQWPLRERNDQHGAMAHEKLVGILGAECVVSLPLRNSDEEIVGVILLVDEPAESVLDLLHRYGAALASCLEALERERGNMFSRTARKVHDKLSSWRGRAISVAAACLALLLVVPFPYRVDGQCQVQPVTRRFVVAPYDGTLESSQVSPGDVVKAGDVLARMDEREISWELASLTADLAHAEKERDSAMAVHRTSGAQLAKLEMERLQVQIKMLEHRIENLAIRSPIDGIVVAGDLEKAQGAPLTIGQTLFEVAPLEKMNVEVNVPEEDIAYVTQEMEVVVNLDAFPDAPITGVIDRIHPQAELRDKESVFVAEFEMGNFDQRLRPGMNGWAEITGQKRSLGWILFHKPWNSMRRAISW